MPEGLEEDILKARSTHTRFGQYWQQIDRLRAPVRVNENETHGVKV
jgi:hypothetical protein